MRREDWDRRYAAVENLWAVKPNRFLVAEVAELPPGRALDLACGEGQNAIWLATLGWSVTGVDYSQVAIDKARDRANREGVEVDFVRADLLDFEPDPRSYDLVLLLYFHLPPAELRTVLAKAQHALAEGGTAVIIGHDRTNITDGVGGPSDPSIHYTPDELSAELAELEIVKATRVLRDVDGEERDAIDALVRARRPHPA
ncbi:MAG TPA: class I SAM-dependent methyltransferase [Gaiellaceae bacterium]|nr:class I SAM-dependent methyltransferase [Gaiellaceae bacterium]